MNKLLNHHIEQMTSDLAQVAFIGDIDALVDKYHENADDCANWIAALRKYADSLEKRGINYYPHFTPLVESALKR